MKVYEYLAAGLPVVATPLPSLAGLAEVTFAATAAETVTALDDLLEADTPALRAERSRDAATHSWEERLEQIGQAVEEAQRR
jgi:hypothetical protein